MNNLQNSADKVQEYLDLAIRAGTILLENGAEIYRVQETIIRILESFGVQDHNVYVLSNGIFATVGETGSHPCNAVRNVPTSSFHLGRIAAVNEVSRAIAHTGKESDLAAMRLRLEECAQLPFSPNWLRMLAGASGAACFCWILGGSPWDSCAALVAGLLLQLFLFWSVRKGISKFIQHILGAGLVTLVSECMLLLGVGSSLDHIIIGAIISLVPGVLLTSAIRELFNSDYLSGSIHLIDALLVAASIAVGVGSALLFWNTVIPI